MVIGENLLSHTGIIVFLLLQLPITMLKFLLFTSAVFSIVLASNYNCTNFDVAELEVNTCEIIFIF